VWLTRERPPRGGELVGREIRPRLDEPRLVERDTPAQPVGAGKCSGHDEHVPDVANFVVSSARVAPLDALELVATLERHDLGVRPQRD
jgi:hypothetical protein